MRNPYYMLRKEIKINKWFISFVSKIIYEFDKFEKFLVSFTKCADESEDLQEDMRTPEYSFSSSFILASLGHAVSGFQPRNVTETRGRGV